MFAEEDFVTGSWNHSRSIVDPQYDWLLAAGVPRRSGKEVSQSGPPAFSRKVFGKRQERLFPVGEPSISASDQELGVVHGPVRRAFYAVDQERHFEARRH